MKPHNMHSFMSSFFFFLLSIIFCNSSVLLRMSLAPPFRWLSCIPVYEYATSCLSALSLIDPGLFQIWGIVSKVAMSILVQVSCPLQLTVKMYVSQSEGREVKGAKLPSRWASLSHTLFHSDCPPGQRIPNPLMAGYEPQMGVVSLGYPGLKTPNLGPETSIFISIDTS